MTITSETCSVEIFSTSNIYLDHVKVVAVLLKWSACNICEDSLKFQVEGFKY